MSRIIIFAAAATRPLYGQNMYGRPMVPMQNHLPGKLGYNRRDSDRKMSEQHEFNIQSICDGRQHSLALGDEETGAVVNPNSMGWAPQFSDKIVRRGFVRRVYSILTAQFLILIGFISFFLYYQPVREFCQKDRTFFYAISAFLFLLILIFFWQECLRRKPPFNFISLLLLTITEGVFLGSAASTFSANVIPLTLGMISFICFALVISNCQTKVDCTKTFTGFVFVFHLILLLFIVLVVVFNLYFPILIVVYSSVVAILFSFYLAYDMHRMIGGENKHIVLPQESIFAVINLYVDIISVFLLFLSLLCYGCFSYD